MNNNNNIYCGDYGNIIFNNTETGTCESNNKDIKRCNNTTDKNGYLCKFNENNNLCETTKIDCNNIEKKLFKKHNKNIVDNLNLTNNDLNISDEISNDSQNTNLNLITSENYINLDSSIDNNNYQKNMNNLFNNSFYNVNQNIINKNNNQDLNTTLMKLNDLENNEINKNYKRLEHISSILSSKQRLINELNKNSNLQDNIFFIITILFIFIFIIIIFKILNSKNIISNSLFNIISIILSIIFILIFIYKFNLFYFRKAFNMEQTSAVIKQLNKNFNKELDNLNKSIKNDVQGNYEDWEKENCKCPPKNQEEDNQEETDLSEEGDTGRLIKNAKFYYDGSSPKQILYPFPKNLPINKQDVNYIFHPDYSLNINPKNNILNLDIKQDKFDNSIMRENYNKNSKTPFDVSDWYVGDVTRTANL